MLKLGGEPRQAVKPKNRSARRVDPGAPPPGRPPRVERVAGDAKLDLPFVVNVPVRGEPVQAQQPAIVRLVPVGNRELLTRGDVGDAFNLDVAPSIFFVPLRQFHRAQLAVGVHAAVVQEVHAGQERVRHPVPGGRPGQHRAQRPRKLFQRDAAAAPREERRVRVAHELRPAQHAPVRGRAP